MSADSPEPQASPKRSRRSRFLDVSAITAIASLVVALIFNGLQVRDNADQARATRRATELQLLTQLNTIVTESQSTIQPRSPEFIRVEREGGELSGQSARYLGTTIKNMDYLAWLYDNGFVTIPDSRQLWGPRMRCIYITALLLYGPTIQKRVENLKRFTALPEGLSVGRLEALRESTC